METQKSLKCCLNNGADPRLVDSSGNRAIDYAESYECKHIIIQWRTEWTDDINKQRNEELDKMVKDFLNSEDLNKEMKEKLRQYLIEQAAEGNYK